MSKDPSELPSFDPQGTESISSIPERFLVDGLLSLRSDGRWFFRGEAIEHKGVSQFLSRQLRRTEEGEYWVVNGPQRVLVELQETPFFITYIEVQQHGITAWLNDQSREPLELEGLFRGPDEVLYARVKRGLAGAKPGAAHLARVLRTAVMTLEPLLEQQSPEEDAIGLLWQGQFYPIPRLDALPPLDS